MLGRYHRTNNHVLDACSEAPLHCGLEGNTPLPERGSHVRRFVEEEEEPVNMAALLTQAIARRDLLELSALAGSARSMTGCWPQLHVTTSPIPVETGGNQP
jgi:hypothetical protein